jgi:hypothetical protein
MLGGHHCNLSNMLLCFGALEKALSAAEAAGRAG